MNTPAPSLKGRALRLLSTREHSRAELERKLANHEEVPGSLAQALDELQAKGFISDQELQSLAAHLGKSEYGKYLQRLLARG